MCWFVGDFVNVNDFGVYYLIVALIDYLFIVCCLGTAWLIVCFDYCLFFLCLFI